MHRERSTLFKVALLVYPHKHTDKGCEDWPCPLVLYGLFQDDEENFDLLQGAVVGLS